MAPRAPTPSPRRSMPRSNASPDSSAEFPSPAKSKHLAKLSAGFRILSRLRERTIGAQRRSGEGPSSALLPRLADRCIGRDAVAEHDVVTARLQMLAAVDGDGG